MDIRFQPPRRAAASASPASLIDNIRQAPLDEWPIPADDSGAALAVQESIEETFGRPDRPQNIQPTGQK